MRRGRRSVRHDVAVYSPFSSVYYDAAAEAQGGGAQLQMTLLARHLASRGWRVAHIVFPIADPIEVGQGLTLHQRPPYYGSGPGLNRLRETQAIWRALRAVDARAYVVRGTAARVAAVAEFSRLHRRGMVFSTANDFDLRPLPRRRRGRFKRSLYLHGVRAADSVVVQSSHQLALARELIRPRQRLELIPSFAESVSAQVRNPDVFLWVSRLTDYKRPLEFVRLARALPEARFVMVTAEDPSSSEQIRQQVVREARSLDNIEVTGPLRRDEVLAYLEHAVAIVSTSVWEGMPNVFLEAWARSVPALSLSFDPDGLISKRGLGIAAGDSWERFVEGAASLWTDAEMRARLGRNAKLYIEGRHAPAAVCQLWERTLRAVTA